MTPYTAAFLWLGTWHLGMAKGYTEWADWLIDCTDFAAGGARVSW